MDGDFGDVLGLDIAYWKNGRGQTFMFTHVICESTLFHMAVGAGRSPEAALSDRWFSFPGVPQVIYVDPAGEYTCEFEDPASEREHKVKGERSRVALAARQSRIPRPDPLKDMLSRMDAEQEIGDEQEFRLSLRQAVWAKNSLSRVKGYTPEQAVYSGKCHVSLGRSPLMMRHLPIPWRPAAVPKASPLGEASSGGNRPIVHLSERITTTPIVELYSGDPVLLVRDLKLEIGRSIGVSKRAEVAV